MKKSLFFFFSITVLFSACARQPKLVPLTEDVSYLNENLVGSKSTDNLKVDVSFEKATKNQLSFQITVTNTGLDFIEIKPSNFHYNLSNSNIKYKAISPKNVSEGIDAEIRQHKKSKETTSILEVVDAFTELGAVIANQDESTEGRLERDLAYESRSNTYLEVKASSSNQIIRLYESKDHLNSNMMRPIFIRSGEVCTGIVVFPRAKNKIKQDLSIIFEHTEERIVIPFGQR